MSADPVHDPVNATTFDPVWYARKGLKALASLQLTVVLFAFSIALVFFGTLAQLDYGIWTVVDKYFWSWYVHVPLDLINKFGGVFLADYFPKDRPPWGGSFPLPGGKLIGGLMLANLLAAHLTRFRFTWKRSGIILTHSGLVLLFVGEFITREYAVEQRMVIEEGETADYTFSTRHVEVAVIDHSDPAADVVAVIPESLLRQPGGRITDPSLPVDVEVVEYLVNSRLAPPKPGATNLATAGGGREVVAERRKEANGITNDEMDFPAAYLRLYKKGTSEELGVYLASLQRTLGGQGVDPVRVGDKTYDLSLRFRRYYKPFAVRLDEFRFDRYLGTNKPKNYSSKILLTDPEAGTEREFLIRMNEPLRYRGETFYQSGFNERTEKGTILQVVRNPGWVIPYASCAAVTLGLALHFAITLTQFLRRRAAA